MAVLFPQLRFFDNNGDVLSSGTVTFYESFSTKLKAVYTNQGEGTQLENPVTLNAYGVPATSGSIWVNGAYRVLVKDQDGNIVGSPLNDYYRINPVDWSTLTATVTQLNGMSIVGIAEGVAEEGTTMLVDSNKDFLGLRSLSAVTLTATTAFKTPWILDSNGVQAFRITTTASAVNGITITPSATGNDVELESSGSDTNIGLTLRPQGSSSVIKFNSFSLPYTDGASNKVLTTNGSYTLSWDYVNLCLTQGSNIVTSTGAGALWSSAVNSISSPISSYYTVINSVTITPVSNASRFLCISRLNLNSSNAPCTTAISLLSGGSESIQTMAYNYANTRGCGNHLTTVLSPSTTGEITISNRYASGSGSVNVHRNSQGFSTSRAFGGVSSCTLLVLEVLE
jgi:hypothetical protein